jgi:hypothetical protein
MAAKILPGPGKAHYYVLDMSHLSTFDASDFRRNTTSMPYWGAIHRSDLQHRATMMSRPGSKPETRMRHDWSFYQIDPRVAVGEQSNVCLMTRQKLSPGRTEAVEKPPRYWDAKGKWVTLTSSAVWREIVDPTELAMVSGHAVEREWMDLIFEDNFKTDPRAEKVAAETF